MIFMMMTTMTPTATIMMMIAEAKKPNFPDSILYGPLDAIQWMVVMIMMKTLKTLKTMMAT